MSRIEPFTAPGGKALEYFSSLRLWLTKSKAKASYIKDEDDLLYFLDDDDNEYSYNKSKSTN